MKKRVRELNLNDLNVQVIVGIILLLVILVLGFVFLNNQINIVCKNSNSNLEAELAQVTRNPSQVSKTIIYEECFDSDKGDNKILKGSTSYGLSSHIDICTNDGSGILEGSCETSGGIKVKELVCNYPNMPPGGMLPPLVFQYCLDDIVMSAGLDHLIGTSDDTKLKKCPSDLRCFKLIEPVSGFRKDDCINPPCQDGKCFYESFNSL